MGRTPAVRCWHGLESWLEKAPNATTQKKEENNEGTEIVKIRIHTDAENLLINRTRKAIFNITNVYVFWENKILGIIGKAFKAVGVDFSKN